MGLKGIRVKQRRPRINVMIPMKDAFFVQFYFVVKGRRMSGCCENPEEKSPENPYNSIFLQPVNYIKPYQEQDTRH